ncbi:small acid-soluble spore protein alpha/beta type [Thermodesulfitimonas autotrophica]|uniref:Small acid-soluble spore protein alpha/beta type n=1 Tax=Thermodesulfitimonas autotrophica TaxID=1894989 RepID=A0A3N5BA66_9THEO|nr:alpha/beta-type small acid-soluble spore protein [Thermodesulfitimonas autotrophica]RPF42555.1 small acid-soluble spore protein alpha/beta type [Thermodesulfitimonas autotrophica]
MPNQKQKRLLVPQAASALDLFKIEVANELGYPTYGFPAITPENYREVLRRMKYEVAGELGLDRFIREGYWGDVPARLCGAVGGRIGGKIGGNMVRRMIKFAEQNLAQPR